MYELIIEAYPDLTSEDFKPNFGKIQLHDDGDGIVYLAKWGYSKPVPEGLKLGK